MGDPSDGFCLTDSFEGLKSLYDPREKFVHGKILPQHDPYGFIDSPFNYEVQSVWCAFYVCGLTDHGVFPEGCVCCEGPTTRRYLSRKKFQDRGARA